MTSSNERAPGAFRPVPRTGVIYVMTEAQRMGFHMDAPDWCNLGQGQPDTGPLADAPARVESIRVEPTVLDYAPVGGLWELREAIAGMYNQIYRRGMPSQYSAENVAVCGGGRVSLMRACASVGQINLGHFLPDYTAYEELLDIFRRFTPIPILLDPTAGYEFPAEELRREVLGRGLGALLMSNPCNPTGKLVHGQTLSDWVAVARELDCTLMLDEFYSHYIWQGEQDMVSATQYVEDVEHDPVVAFDGLTKNWRYPGWRVTWAIGPRRVMDAMTSAGSFLDGGGSHPMQAAARPLLDPDYVQQETHAIRESFRAKRDLLVSGLRELGVRFDCEPEGTFYAWGDLSRLPESINTGTRFFRAALEHKVITVPGDFFDVDPGKRRLGRPSRFRHHVRFSFGPEISRLKEALGRLRQLVAEAS